MKYLGLGTALGLAVLLSCVPGVAWCAMTPEMQVQEVVNINATPSHTPSTTPSLTSTSTATPSTTPTPTATPLILCTPPACATDEQLYCPTSCPGGCGHICVTITPKMPTPVPRIPIEAIVPGNVHLLEPLVVIFADAKLTDLAFRGNTEIVTVGYTERISRWDLSTGREIAHFGVHSEGTLAIRVATSPDRSRIASGGGAWDNRVRLWNIDGDAMRELGRHDDIVAGLAFNPNGTLLASGDGADDVQIWDVNSGQPVIGFRGDVPQYAQRFANLYWLDGETLAAAGNQAIYWWNVTTGALQETLTIPEGAPFFVDVAFAQNTDRLAAAAQVDRVYVWDRAVGEWFTWEAQPNTDLRQVTFSPDGRLLAAGSATDGLFLWDVTEQELVAHLPVPAADIVALEFSPDGRYLAAIGWDLTIWLWGIPPDMPQAVPEPPTLVLLGISLAILTGFVALQIRARCRTGTG